MYFGLGVPNIIIIIFILIMLEWRLQIVLALQS